MPFAIRKKKNEYCVVNSDTGKEHGCHPSKKKAREQQKALYANTSETFSLKKPELVTRSERDRLDASVFADPENRLFPVRSTADLVAYDGLLPRLANGDRLKIRLAQVATSQGISVPEYWTGAGFSEDDESEDDETDLVIFSAEEDDEAEFSSDEVAFDRKGKTRKEGEYVVYEQAKIFPAGWYESHNYGMTPEELIAAANFCSQAKLDVEHKDKSIIKSDFLGHGAKFTGAWEDDSFVMRGDIFVHEKLDPLLQDDVGLSATWQRDTKTLSKIALTMNPRVSDAALKTFAAEFARTKKHETRTGKTAIQSLHDRAVMHGAVCDVNNAKMTSKSENKVIQEVHDMTAKAGAECESIDKNPIWSYYTDSGESNEAGEEEATMGQSANGNGNGQGNPNPPANPNANTAEMSALQQQVEMQNRQLAQFAEERRTGLASQFADGLVSKEIIKPKDRNLVAAFHAQLQKDDNGDEADTIEFTGDVKATRTQAFESLFASLKPSRLTNETLKIGNPKETRFALGEDDADDDGEVASGIRARARKHAGVPAATAGANGNGANGGK